MTEQITISKIYLNDTNKAGQPYLDKSSRPFKMIKIVTQEGRTLWGRAYQGSPVLAWKVGDTHEVEVETSDNGFLNFRLPKASPSYGNNGMQMAEFNARLNSYEAN